MLDNEIFVLKFLSIDTETTCAISSCKITALGHEIRNDSVEGAALVNKVIAL